MLQTSLLSSEEGNVEMLHVPDEDSTDPARSLSARLSDAQFGSDNIPTSAWSIPATMTALFDGLIA
jgi:hypothetical protein